MRPRRGGKITFRRHDPKQRSNPTRVSHTNDDRREGNWNSAGKGGKVVLKHPSWGRIKVANRLSCDYRFISNNALTLNSDPNPKPETNAQAYKPQLKPNRRNIWGLSQSNSAMYKYYPNPSPNLNWPPHHAPCDKDYGVGIYVYKLLG